MNSMTIIKQGDIRGCVRFVCENCGHEWKVPKLHVYNRASNETWYFMDCHECGKKRVKGEKER